MKIVLYNPEIPQNTGNIIRTCSVTNTELILVRPLGFSLSSRMLKRSGLDYIKDIKITQIDERELLDLLKNKNLKDFYFYFFSSKAKKSCFDINFKKNKNSILIFGSETKGLPKSFQKSFKDHFYKIPMKQNARCLNLSNAVAIVLYEALRQLNFDF